MGADLETGFLERGLHDLAVMERNVGVSDESHLSSEAGLFDAFARAVDAARFDEDVVGTVGEIDGDGWHDGKLVAGGFWTGRVRLARTTNAGGSARPTDRGGEEGRGVSPPEQGCR